MGIDIGGTFTDAFAANERHEVISAKAPSTPSDYSQAVLTVVDELASSLEVTSQDLLGQTQYICHGTTSTLNALVTGATAKVGFVTTRGHADSIRIMNLEGRYAGLDADEIQNMPRTNKPAPLLPRRLVREIDERVDYKGAVVVPLDDAGARQAVEELLAEDVEAIAVSLLWSFLNPAHELRLREIVHELSPDLYVGLSCEVSPRIREYSRSTTTIMNTQVGPRLRDYVVPLGERLRDRGFDGSLLIMQGSGGTIAAADAPRKAITTIGSVLTGGVIGCVNLGRSLGHENIISTDMGGTTFLVGMVVDGKPITSASTVLNQHTITTPMVQIHTIGAGGGAIAWLDLGGNLRVGPRSAGADPGPACYGQGGSEPTVTDADVVLGILNPDFFLGGRRHLEKERSIEAIDRRIAGPLGLSVEDAAAAIYTIQNAQAADLVRRVVVNAGYDPRDFVLYSFGGAGPVHCGSYAADLEAREIVVPLGPTAAAFSAFGLAASNVVISAEISRPENAPMPAATVNEAFGTLESDVRRHLEEQNLSFSEVTIRREVDVRYTLQLAEVPTPVKNGELSEAEVAAIVVDFEELYERLYGKGSGFSEAGLQFITYRVYGTGHLPFAPELPEFPPANGRPPVPKTTRRAFLGPDDGWEDAAIYDYQALAAGHELSGPAIVEAPTTTVVIPRKARATVDRLGNIVMRFS